MSVAAAQENIQVAVRIRPATLAERVGSFRHMVKKVDSGILTFDPEETSDGRCDRKSILPDKLRRKRIGMRRCRNLSYAYDHVFDEDCGQSLIFERTTRPLIDFVTQGFAATVFAYGATGSGKTHTMLGSAATGPGVMVLAIEALFDAMHSAEEEHSFALRVSYLEVYNETIRDLLAVPGVTAPPGGLELRHEPTRGVSVCGLTEHEPEHASEVLELIERGNKARCVAETAANAQSSRSHAVLQIRLRRSSRAAGVKDELSLGQLTLIDLAGSERAAVSLNRGSQLKEGANINRSLLALGNCINALSSGKRGCHVPYRDSKLTRLLQDSLGGNCRTVMIATVSPAPAAHEDTHNTLKYAHRAKEIKVAARTRTQTVEYGVSKYQELIANLQDEVRHWKLKSGHRDSLPSALDAPLPGGLLHAPLAPTQVSSTTAATSAVAGIHAGAVVASPVPSHEGAELFAAIDALYTRRASAQQQLWELQQAAVDDVTTDDAPPPPPPPPDEKGEAAADQATRQKSHARVRAQLEAVLVQSDAEEAEVRALLEAVRSPERRAVLHQEMRCRQLQLENAQLQQRLGAATATIAKFTAERSAAARAKEFISMVNAASVTTETAVIPTRRNTIAGSASRPKWNTNTAVPPAFSSAAAVAKFEAAAAEAPRSSRRETVNARPPASAAVVAETPRSSRRETVGTRAAAPREVKTVNVSLTGEAAASATAAVSAAAAVAKVPKENKPPDTSASKPRWNMGASASTAAKAAIGAAAATVPRRLTSAVKGEDTAGKDEPAQRIGMTHI
ncbi:kinesin-like protein kif18a-like protein [Chrysochromulina tobinii]|uniref:Kinesin-like protein n=1 Tax=Chrysochromulina tobinii TaxID=1460289 RepID=A0A0M0LQN8_9EUKA|nr:kinesin-like protein kif18a-like protein [Chrysochromulina tobinii]|eukprot:KOO53033.1 kinesin-like protein kif18a-like protein [Chrysochromulina sp. CCMP291]